ncbi:receptor kinase ZAR1 [Olea europaea subsp. europaea]|uniref:Receptor kinase ZAR1 n=1 Tax=Olea europaea subsp. europaea TaxID=158383 RepID=A0A8S0QTP3_OLEEU|nr:receptor kinase ZAR1 [Olea europaea subsp. europaea]
MGGPDSEGKTLNSHVRKVFREERPLSEIIDPDLLHEVRAKKQVVAAFHIALICTELDLELRPRMRTVSDNLDCIKLLSSNVGWPRSLEPGKAQVTQPCPTVGYALTCCAWRLASSYHWVHFYTSKWNTCLFVKRPVQTTMT